METHAPVGTRWGQARSIGLRLRSRHDRPSALRSCESTRNVRPRERIALGMQHDLFEGARVFVLPNPSGRNANFSYAEMLAAFAGLKSHDTV